MKTTEQRFPVGTEYMTRGKAPRLCVVKDFLVTRNLAGDVVKTRYVSTHEICGQIVEDNDVCETTIAMGVLEPKILS